MHDIAVSLIDTTALLLQSETGDAGALGGDAVLGAAIVGAAMVAVGCILRWRLWTVPAQPIGRIPVELPLWLMGALIAYAAGAFGTAVPAPADAAYARLVGGAVGNAAQALVAAIFLVRFTQPAKLPATAVPRAALMGAAAFLMVTPIVAALSIVVNALLEALGLPRAPDESHQTLLILAERRDPLLTALTLAHVALLVPVAEELIWRGMVQPGLRGAAGVRVGIAATAALFTLIHWSAIAPDGRIVGLSMLFALALGLGILRERTGSVVAPIVVHALFNAFNVALTLVKNHAP